MADGLARACRARPRRRCDGGGRPRAGRRKPRRRARRRDFVQENTPETLEAKRQIFAELDRLAPPDAILASSTSTIVASRFTENLAGPAPLPGGASGQSPASRAAGRARRRAVDRARHVVSAPRRSTRRSGRCRSWSSARSKASSSTACRPCCCRRRSAWSEDGFVIAAGPRQDAEGRPRPALVVHGAV